MSKLRQVCSYAHENAQKGGCAGERWSVVIPFFVDDPRGSLDGGAGHTTRGSLDVCLKILWIHVTLRSQALRLRR